MRSVTQMSLRGLDSSSLYAFYEPEVIGRSIEASVVLFSSWFLAETPGLTLNEEIAVCARELYD